MEAASNMPFGEKRTSGDLSSMQSKGEAESGSGSGGGGPPGAGAGEWMEEERKTHVPPETQVPLPKTPPGQEEEVEEGDGDAAQAGAGLVQSGDDGARPEGMAEVVNRQATTDEAADEPLDFGEGPEDLTQRDTSRREDLEGASETMGNPGDAPDTPSMTQEQQLQQQLRPEMGGDTATAAGIEETAGEAAREAAAPMPMDVDTSAGGGGATSEMERKAGRPLSAFRLWMQENHDSMMQEFGNDEALVMKKGTARWKKLDVREKTAWKELEEKNRELHRVSHMPVSSAEGKGKRKKKEQSAESEGEGEKEKKKTKKRAKKTTGDGEDEDLEGTGEGASGKAVAKSPARKRSKKAAAAVTAPTSGEAGEEEAASTDVAAVGSVSSGTPHHETTITINRAPVLTLWAVVVAEKLGYPHETALSLGRFISSAFAVSKGQATGMLPKGEEGGQAAAAAPQARIPRKAHAKTISFFNTTVKMQTFNGVEVAVFSGKAIEPRPVESYLDKAFGSRLGAVRDVMKGLAGRIGDNAELDRRAYDLYMVFRPDIPAGASSWGAKGTLDLEKMAHMEGGDKGSSGDGGIKEGANEAADEGEGAAGGEGAERMEPGAEGNAEGVREE